MAATKRPHADSDTEESSNAKRHNGGAREHEENEGQLKDPPSRNHSKQTKSAEQQHDAEQNAEGPDSKKRARELESTGAPEANASH